jgi:hypothetical protein
MGGASSSTLAGLPRVEEHPPVATPAKVKATAPRSFTEIARSEEALAAQTRALEAALQVSFSSSECFWVGQVDARVAFTMRDTVTSTVYTTAQHCPHREAAASANQGGGAWGDELPPSSSKL